MADDSKQLRLSFQFVQPAERIMTFAQASIASPDENLRAVAKAVLDVTAAASTVQRAMAEDGKVDLAPYLDFWFADAISSAQKLLQYEGAESRDLARCLIDAEKAVIESKESVLIEFKRLGIKPLGG